MIKLEFKELFKLYSTDIFNYSHSLLKNRDDAKDAVQDVFVRFFETQNSFRGECSVKTWLLVITRNYCYRKLNKTLPQIESLEDETPISYEETIHQKITVDDILDSLKPDEYELVYLREYAGYSYNEICDILGMSLENVKIRLFRIRQKLKRIIE